MAFFEWKDEYSGGIEKIDEQHKVIIKLMNQLYEAIRYEKEELIIKDVFVELLKYANYHFGLEVMLFDKYQYSEKEKHKNEHDHFIEKIKDLMISDYLTDRNIPIETLHYLRSWFQEHMLKIDLDYCKYFAYKECMDEIDAYLKAESNS